MERIPILKMGDCLLVTIQVDMHDRLAMSLQDDLTERIAATHARGVLIDISALEVVDSFMGRMLGNIAAMSRVLDAQTVVVGMQPAVAITLVEARDALAVFRPRAIVLDVLLRGEDGWGFLAELKRREDTRTIPVAVVSTVEDECKGIALGADAYWVKPIDRQRPLQLLTGLAAPESVRRILVVDDEEISRYVLRRHLAAPEHVVVEAADGAEALRRVREDRPDVICLDLAMPGMDGVSVLRALEAEADTRDIPVVVVTSRRLEEAEARELLGLAAGILPKEEVSRENAIACIDRALRARAAA